MNYKYLFGSEIQPLIDRLSKMRISEFKEYPYLYIGNDEYERNYLKGFSKDPRSCLAVASETDQIVAIATAMPLRSETDILRDIESKFSSSGESWDDFYYFGEFLVLPKYRGLGLARKMEEDLERIARGFGFTKLCLATVIRGESDPRRPAQYRDTSSVWTQMGFHTTAIEIEYHWPTVLEDGSISEVLNPMRFWMKEIS